MFSTDQVFVIGMIASVLVYLINYLTMKGVAVNLGRGWLTVLLFVVSVPLAWWFDPQAFPVFGGFGGDVAVDVTNAIKYAGDIVGILTAVVGSATAIYNIILKRIVEAIGNKYG